MKWTEKYKKAITFSYDDGITQDIRLVELMNKYGIKCTFNINSEKMGMPGTLEREGNTLSFYRLTAYDVKKVYEGHEIASHTLLHKRLTEMTDEGVIEAVEKDRLTLSELVGYEVVGFAYPCGGVNHDDRVARIIKEHTGVKYARTNKKTDSMQLQHDLYKFLPNVSHVMQGDRLDVLTERLINYDGDEPQILYIYGHSFELDFDNKYWAKLEEYFKFISGRKDIFLGTNKEVLL